ncbi:MAG: DUF5789 family protein [Haloferacaceae archaeon]
MRLNRTGEAIGAHEYPATSGELIEAYGERTIELVDETETVAEVLGRLEETVYDDAQAVEEALFSAVSAEAVGRRHYSDRDPGTPGQAYGPDPVSF